MFYILFVYLFLCLSVTYAWSDTEFTRSIRNFIAKIPYIRKPFLCHECSSFWISLVISFFINPFFELTYPFLSNIFSAFSGFFINLYFVRNHLIKYQDF
jgi:hypothetical protein